MTATIARSPSFVTRSTIRRRVYIWSVPKVSGLGACESSALPSRNREIRTVQLIGAAITCSLSYIVLFACMSICQRCLESEYSVSTSIEGSDGNFQY